MSETKVTIFTPTYNRSDRIHILFDSLLKQTVKDFEWFIVDDGNDNTAEQIKKYKEKADFPIVYYKPSGDRGISRAMNYMVLHANGFLVMKVDDDDFLTSDAVELVLKVEMQIADQRKQYAGVSGLRAYPDGSIIGGEWDNKNDYVDATNLERRKYGLLGDKAEAYYLTALQEYGPMPTFPGEYYTWEGVLWDRIAHSGLKIRWFNRPIYITEYLPGGATANRIEARSKNFLTYTQLVSERLTYEEVPFIERLILSCRYFELARSKGRKFIDIKSVFSNSLNLARLGYFLSFITAHIPSSNEN